MAFQAKLRVCAQRMERHLDGLLTACPGSKVPPRLLAAMRHACLDGGKRFRPFVVVESAGLFGVPAERAMHAAAAIELVHCYSLVHDDLPAMDNDTLRRGRPTVHVAFDEATAILAGDTLLTLAFELLARPATHTDAAARLELVVGLARAAGGDGMAGGQMLDLEAEGRPLDVAGIAGLQAMKTGALIAFACEAGAILGAASSTEKAALLAYGRALGLAFQISDDLLDAEGDSAVIGKTAGKDAEVGKATFVSLLGAGKARERLERVIAEGVAALRPFGEHGAELKEAIGWMGARTT